MGLFLVSFLNLNYAFGGFTTPRYDRSHFHFEVKLCSIFLFTVCFQGNLFFEGNISRPQKNIQ